VISAQSSSLRLGCVGIVNLLVAGGWSVVSGVLLPSVLAAQYRVLGTQYLTRCTTRPLTTDHSPPTSHQTTLPAPPGPPGRPCRCSLSKPPAGWYGPGTTAISPPWSSGP